MYYFTNRVVVVLPCRTASRVPAADVSMLKPLCRGRACQLPDNQLFAYVVRLGFPNGPFRRLRWPVLHCETARFAMQSGIGVKTVAGMSFYGCIFCCWLQGAASVGGIGLSRCGCGLGAMPGRWQWGRGGLRLLPGVGLMSWAVGFSGCCPKQGVGWVRARCAA